MADRPGRPLIAVTGPQSGAVLPRLCIALGIRLAGGRSVQLRPGDPLPTAEAFCGVVISGGHDVDPVLYAEQSSVKPNYDAERDAFESRVIDDALARNLPVLGICRGAQLLNVRCGGNLHQDLRTHRRKTSNRRTILPLKTVRLCSGSNLARITGADELRVNSLHNQAINRLGDKLSITARDQDDLVQGIEGPGCVLGVQWHPEFLLYARSQRRLFQWLVRNADDG